MPGSQTTDRVIQALALLRLSVLPSRQSDGVGTLN